MIYISYEELARDVLAWSYQLPRDIDVFVGIPRSGIIPATMLALHRNVRFTSLEDFRNGRILRGGFRDQHENIETAMVIDDSILSGKSMQRAIKALSSLRHLKILYGAVYTHPNIQEYKYFKIKPTPRIFQWNWLHHFWLNKACMDIDGVLCRDPTSEENDDGPRYRKFLRTAEPLNIPTVEVNTLVTSRLEKYRLDTIRWLRKWNVHYKKLIMHPAKNAIERRQLKDHAKRKAKVYLSKDYQLFIESSNKQAEYIHAKTNKPVLCTDTGYFYF